MGSPSDPGPRYRPPTPFPDPACLAVARELEAGYPAIRQEAAGLLEIPFWPEWRPYGEPDSYAGAGRWDVAALYGGGRGNERLLRRCPVIARVLGQVPDLRQALLSSLSPRTRILPHEGAPGILRVHLPLMAEPGRSGWRVAGESRPCVEGQLVLFEDGCLHEAWNDADTHRIPLLFDTPAPHLGPQEREGALAAYDRQMAGGRATVLPQRRGG